MQVLCDDYRAATPLEGSLYCAYHTEATRGAAAPNGDQARSSSSGRLSVLRLPHRKQEAARGDQPRRSSSRRLSVLRLPHRSEAGPSGDQARSSSSRRLSVLRLPHSSEARPSGAPRRPHAQQLLQKALCTAPATQQRSAAQRRPAATKRAAAPPEGSLYCACHTESEAGPAAPSGDEARRNSSRRLSVLRLPRKSHRTAQRRPAATKRAAAPSGGSLYCACHAKATARPSGDQARSSSFRRLSILRLPRKNHRAAQRRPSAQQLLQEALCTAPATQKQPRGPAATKRAAAPSGGSLYCACHAKASAQKLLQEALCTAPATQQPPSGPAATKRAAAPSGGSLYCACHTKARRTPAAPSGDQARRSSCDQARSSSFRRLSILRLPRKSHRTAQRRPAATKRAAAPSGGSLYCACHAKTTARPSGAQRRPSAQQLLQEALCTAPATQKQPRGPAATKRAAAPSGGSLYCACHAKASAQKLLQEALCTAPATQQPPSGPAAPSGDQARSSSFRRLSVLRLPHKSKAHPSGAQRRPSAQKLLQEALCTAPATQKPPSGPAAPSGDQARRSSFRRLSVLRLPRKSQRAAQRRPAATKRAAAPSGGSLYCACHAKATARPSGAQRRPSAQQLLQEALCTAPATQKHRVMSGV